MKRSLLFPLCMASVLALRANGTLAETNPVGENFRGHENQEWNEYRAFHLTDEKRDLPRFLLIGDSITVGYQDRVRSALEGRWNESRWVSSYCVTSTAYRPMLEILLAEASYDVIHFNNGLHSLNTPTADWKRAFREALLLIRARQPKARIVWATSTPMADPERTAKVRELNAAAHEVIGELGGIEVDDLFALMDTLDRSAYWTDRCHFKSSAIWMQAQQVVSSCLRAAGQGDSPVALQAACQMLVDEAIASGEQGAVQFCAYKDGKCIVDVWGGSLSTNAGAAKVDGSTLFPIFSTEKPLLATAVHRAVERGLMDYDLPLKTWWPEFTGDGKERLTLRETLGYRSGMPGGNPGKLRGRDLADWDLVVRTAAADKPELKPGTKQRYMPKVKCPEGQARLID